MAELDVWRTFLDQDKLQDLPAADRAALLSIGVQIADDESDGFLPRGAIRRVPWGEGPADLLDRINRLALAGWFNPIDEPAGWEAVGWLLDSPGRARQSVGSPSGWGQTPASARQERRERARLRSERYRKKESPDVPS